MTAGFRLAFHGCGCIVQANVFTILCPSLETAPPMKPGTIPAVTFAAVLALSSVAAYALPENYEARLRALNSTIRDDAPAKIWSDAYPIGIVKSYSFAEKTIKKGRKTT